MAYLKCVTNSQSKLTSDTTGAAKFERAIVSLPGRSVAARPIQFLSRSWRAVRQVALAAALSIALTSAASADSIATKHRSGPVEPTDAESSRQRAPRWLLPNQPLPVPANGPDNRPYWPLDPGYTWILEDTVTHLPTRVAVYSLIQSFGPSTQYQLPIVYDVHFEKTDPSSYWDVGTPWNLHWFLGYDNQGFLLSTGTWFWDFTTGLQAGDTWNNYSGDSQHPPYLLLSPNPANGQNVTYPLAYPRHAGVTYAPLTDGVTGNAGYTTGMWSVTWTAENISVPAYSGPVITAHYDEGGNQVEDWSFARGVGLVRIISRLQGGNPTRENGPVEIDLVSYSLNATDGLPYVLTLRDQLAAAANAYAGLTFTQWSTYYEQINPRASVATAAQACLDASQQTQTLDIDTFFSLMNGAGSCTTPAQVPAPIAPRPVTCQLRINGSAGPAHFTADGEIQSYTLVSNTDNLRAYWLQRLNGLPDLDVTGTAVSYFPTGSLFTTSDPNGATFVYPPFAGLDATLTPSFARQIELRDQNGSTVCTTNSVQIYVSPSFANAPAL